MLTASNIPGNTWIAIACLKAPSVSMFLFALAETAGRLNGIRGPAVSFAAAQGARGELKYAAS